MSNLKKNGTNNGYYSNTFFVKAKFNREWIGAQDVQNLLFQYPRQVTKEVSGTYDKGLLISQELLSQKTNIKKVMLLSIPKQ
jgi:hypothetical protein